jgi:FkbM family methyltransferase
MNRFSINPNPLMSDYLVKSAEVFAADPIVILDIGARGGFNTEWEVLGDQCRIYCFEPDKAEFERLKTTAPAHVTYIPCAVGGKSGPAVLYEAKLGASTSLYKTDMNYFGRLLNRDNGIVVAEHSVQVSTLDEVLTKYKIPPPNFIKLDVEGAEVDVLAGAASHLDVSTLLGVLSEIRFQREINGSPPFAHLDMLLQRAGLRLFDLQFSHQSRRAMPYPSLEDYRLPSGERFFAYTTHGQIQDGDALYFRDFLVDANRQLIEEISPRAILKLCAFLELYSFNDCAAELILALRERLAPIVDCSLILDLLASGVTGRTISYDQYIRDYFDPPKRMSNVSRKSGRTFIQFSRDVIDWLPPWVAWLIRRTARKTVQTALYLNRRLTGGGPSDSQ